MTTVAVDVLLAERHRDRFGQIQGNAVDWSLRAWDGLEDWTSPAAADTWAELWLPIDGAATSASAVSTDAYFSLVADTEGLEFGGLSAAELRGVPDEVYARRPFAELYRLLGEGKLWADAFAAARDRLSAMVATDVSLGQRKAASDWAAAGKVVGYRRTLTGKSCALCATASTQRYHGDQLMPIHGRCDCGVAPIKGRQDPGRVINQQLLDDLQQSSNRSAYWKDRDLVVEDGRVSTASDGTFMAKVRQHGELGPVLVAPGDHFQGPSITN